MLDLVGNPEARFSHNEAHIIKVNQVNQAIFRLKNLRWRRVRIVLSLAAKNISILPEVKIYKFVPRIIVWHYRACPVMPETKGTDLSICHRSDLSICIPGR